MPSKTSAKTGIAIGFSFFWALLVGCAGGDASGIDKAFGPLTSPYLAFDLRKGEYRSQGEIEDVEALADNKDVVLFQRIEKGTQLLGSDARELGHEDDETLRQHDHEFFYLAVTECTRQQWNLIAELAGRPEATSPWLELDMAVVPEGGDLPAHQLSFQQIQDVLNAYNQGKESTLVLPTAEQWEAACRTGTSNRAYHFTEHRDAEGEQATADSGKQVQVPAQEMLARFAHLHETRSLNEIGPFPVATREADSIGLFDMHGNVWEFCADGSIRGGSWHDAALQARTANSHSIDPHLPHPAVGCRLLLRP